MQHEVYLVIRNTITFCLLVVVFVAEDRRIAASEMRVISETIIGEPLNEGKLSAPETNALDERPKVSAVRPTREQSRPLDVAGVKYQLSANTAFSQILTKPMAARSTTNLKSDPVSGAFGLSGYEHSVELKRINKVTDAYVGLVLSKGSFDGSVAIQQGLDTSKVSTLDSRVNLDTTSIGLKLGTQVINDSDNDSAGSAFIGVTRHEYELAVSDQMTAYIGGFPFSSSDIETQRGHSLSVDLGIGHEVVFDSRFRLGISQLYRTPLAGDALKYRQFATQVILSRDFGPGGTHRSHSSQKPTGVDCRAFEVLGGEGFSSISGTETSSSAKRSIDVDNELGWSSSQLGARIRFGNTHTACHEVGLLRSERTVNYAIQGLDVDSSINLPLSGYELRYSYQPNLIQSEASQTYASFGTGLWIGDGKSSATSSFTFDDVSSTDTDDTELILFDVGVGIGFRQFLSEDKYLFYELSTARYDGRPLGKDVHGWENNIRAGIGFH